eukprot:s1864_g25.t1
MCHHWAWLIFSHSELLTSPCRFWRPINHVVEACLLSNTSALMADVQAVVETQEDEEQKMPDEKPTCCKCGSSTEDFDSHSKMCRQCWNVHQMMYRHLGGAPSTLVSMKVEDQKKFYKDVGSQLKVTPKNGRWALIRAAMVKSMTHYRKEERVNSVKRKYLPLNVLEKKGFDVEAIRAHGDRRDDEVFGEVFAAPILTISNDELVGEIEEEIAQKEWQLRSKKKNDKRKQPVANGDGDQVIPVVDDEIWEVPSDDEPSREPASKAAKKAEDKAEKEAAKEAAKQEKTRETAWRKEISKAAKVIGSLNTVTEALANAKVRAHKNAELFAAGLLDGIDEAITKLTGFKASATALLSATPQQKLAGMPVTFEDVGDVQSAVKAAQQVLADVRKIFAEKVQANRAAKGEGAGQPKAAAKRSAKGSAKGSAKAKAKP